MTARVGADWTLASLPLRPDILGRLLDWCVARVGPNPLRIAHALGDMRWAAGFAGNAHDRADGGAALASFTVTLSPEPRIHGYTRYSLDTLGHIPTPGNWPDDPIDWDAATARPLSSLLDGTDDRTVFSMVAPICRRAAAGPTERGRSREIDIRDRADNEQKADGEAALLGRWIAARWGKDDTRAGLLIGASCAVIGHGAVSCIRQGGPPFTPTLVSARLRVGDRMVTADRLARGIGRYKCFGLGFVYDEKWLEPTARHSRQKALTDVL